MSWDLLFDVTEAATALKMMTLVDEYSRFCLAIRVERNLTSKEVIEVLSEAISQSGRRKHIRSDNGPEFIAQAIQHWLQEHGIGTVYIKPGSPWENPWIESFHSRFRDECLNREWFINVADAQAVVMDHREEYNHHRPHSSLGYLTPAKVFFKDASQSSGSSRATPSLRQSFVLPTILEPLTT